MTEGEQAEEASKEMKQFLEGDFNISQSELNQVDNLLQDNVITLSIIQRQSICLGFRQERCLEEK